MARERSITPTTFKTSGSLSHNLIPIRQEYTEVGNLISREQTAKTEYHTTITTNSTALKSTTLQVTEAGKFSRAEKELSDLATLVTGEFDSRIERYVRYQEEIRKFLEFLKGEHVPTLSIQEYYPYENKIGRTQNEVTRFGIETSTLSKARAAELGAICVPSSASGSVKSLTSMKKQTQAVKEYLNNRDKTTECEIKNISAFKTPPGPQGYKNVVEELLRVYNENAKLFCAYVQEAGKVLEGECTTFFVDL